MPVTAWTWPLRRSPAGSAPPRPPLRPLVDLLRREVIAGSAVLHGDDTPIPVLAPGSGTTRTSRLWTNVRDERPRGGARASAAVLFASPDRRGERPFAHLAGLSGVLVADGYAGFNELYEEARPDGALTEAACWAHVRRGIFDVHAATGSVLAAEALVRIGTLYGIERELHGKTPDARTRERQARAKPLGATLKVWAESNLTQLPGRSELAKALRTMMARWPALTRAFDGRIALDNNAAERTLRGVAVGRKNDLFAGYDLGAERTAAFYILIETAKLNRLDPEAYCATCSHASAGWDRSWWRAPPCGWMAAVDLRTASRTAALAFSIRCQRSATWVATGNARVAASP